MMAAWVDWDDIFAEMMQEPGFKEEFEKGYAEFTKKMDAEIAAERAAFRHVFSPKRNKRASKVNPFARKGRAVVV